jgi:presequence protease
LKSLIDKLRQEIARGAFFQKLIRKYFLENQSRLVLTMRPDVNFDDKFKVGEKTLLAAKLDALSEADRKNVYEQGLALLEAQEKPDDLSSLPTLTVKDIPVKVEIHPVEKELSGKVPVQWRIAPTNGISYFKAMSSLNGLPDHLRPYLALFADALSSLGTTSKSASEFEDEINLKTDGITGSIHISTSHSGTSCEFNVD